MNTLDQTYRRGFTLIELLLYLSLAASMLAILGSIGIDVLGSRVKAGAYEEVGYNAYFIAEKILTSVRGAQAIASPSVGATSTVLTLRVDDPTKDPTVFNLIDGSVRMQEGGGEPVLVSGGTVVVPFLLFSNVTHENGPGSIRLELTVESYNPGESTARRANATLFTTASLRYTP